MAIATSRCTQATATIFLSSLRETRARKRRCIAGGYLEGMPIPARSIPTRVGGKSLSTGTSTELHTHGQEAALLAPTLIRGDRTQRGKCCVSSLSICSHSSEVCRRGPRPFFTPQFFAAFCPGVSLHPHYTCAPAT